MIKFPKTLPATHSWLKTFNLAYKPTATNPLIDRFAVKMMDTFRGFGHNVQNDVDSDTNGIFTTASFGLAVNWRDAPMLTGRRKYHINHTPTVFTIIKATPQELSATLSRLDDALSESFQFPQNYNFDGIPASAYQSIYEQGQRGGALLSLMRILQSQTKSIRIILLVGEKTLEYAYLFDLVGSHPRLNADGFDQFYADLVTRISTIMSTNEVTNHQVITSMIDAHRWKTTSIPEDMCAAAAQFDSRDFFTQMVEIGNLVQAPIVHQAISNQYSEGCFATWDPGLNCLVSTITGSARPIDKGAITPDDLAVIAGLRENKDGALVQHVSGRDNSPPSSEAVEMMAVCLGAPTRVLPPGSVNGSGSGPTARSFLHGHRGVAGYDPRLVEFVPLDPPFYHYPVSCGTAAQAVGVENAFMRSSVLDDSEDSRKIAFTVLPGHGVVIVERWEAYKKPFQLIWEFMDQGIIRIDNFIPQGFVNYQADLSGSMVLISV